MDENEKNPVSHKVLDILLLYRGGQSAYTIDDISQQLDLPKSSVYRYVRTLCDKGFLEKTGASLYGLGLAFIELSRVALNSNRDLRLMALPIMQHIAEQIGESVTLMRMFDKQAVCIETIEGRYALRVTMERGRTQPLHAGASSKVLLAHQPEDTWRDHLDFPLTPFTATTITDFATLQTQLRHIREQGYGISDGEIDSGARAIAVPLVNGQGNVLAALSIEGPSTRMDDETLAQYLPLLQQAIEDIRQKLN